MQEENLEARRWADEIVQMVLGRAAYLDSNYTPRAHLGNTATILYDAIRNKKGVGRRGLMFTAELEARFSSYPAETLESCVRNLQDDRLIVPVHYHTIDGKTRVGYRVTRGTGSVDDECVDALVSIIRKAGVKGVTASAINLKLPSKFRDFSSALDRLQSTGRVIEHMTGNSEDTWFTMAVQMTFDEDDGD